MKKKFRAGRALAGLALLLFTLACWRSESGPLAPLERAGYDAFSRLRQDLDPSSEVVVVAVDEASLEREGPWPWPRARTAELLLKLAEARPRVVALEAFYEGPDRNPGLEEIESLRRRMAELGGKAPAKPRYEAEFSSSIARLDSDARLLAALTTSQNVVLPFELSSERPEEPPPALARHALAEKASAGAPTSERQARRARAPFEPLLKAAAAVGHARLYPDEDGVLRREAVAARVGDRYFLSYAVAAAALHLGRAADSVRLAPGSALEMAQARIPLDATNSMQVTFNGPDHTFRHYPAHQALDGRIPAEVLRDKLVFVGPTAGPAAGHRVPVARALSSVEFAANVADNVLDRRFVSRPDWAAKAELAALAVCGIFVMAALPRMRLGGATLAAGLVSAAVWGAAAYLFREKGQWLRAAHPGFLVAAGWFMNVLLSAAAPAEEAAERPSSAPGAAPEPSGGPAPAEPLRFGRYEVVRELGRGAMGVVYLAKDPKLGREVAIKTVKAEDGASAEETRSMRQRLLREAESAGALDHPGIVRVYDAGEEGGLCYVAMEPVAGQSLSKFASKDSLLAPEKAIEAVAKAADALDYAHQKGVVHRDVKPANIMITPEGSVRVTDFGIARASAASATASGSVIGTPAYMSPEQIAGRPVDGRTDVFSLGVALFELLTGQRPFWAENVNATLLQIASKDEPDPAALRPGLPAGVCAVVHKALKKSPEERYRRASEMAAALRACLAAAPAAREAAAPVPAAGEAGTATLTPEEIARSLTLPMDEPVPAPAPEEGPASVDGLEETVSLRDLEAILPDLPEAPSREEKGKPAIELRLPDEPS